MKMFRTLWCLTATLLCLSPGLSAATLTGASPPSSDLWLWLGIGALGVVTALPSGVDTLVDYAKSLDPDGKVARVINMLAQTNEMLDEMTWVEGNLPTGHRSTILTGLPAVYYRMLNAGVPPSKETTAQVDDQTAMLEAWSEVDKDLALLNGNVSAYRMKKAKPFLEAMNQRQQLTTIYGNQGLTPAEFTGFMPRYSSLAAGNAEHIIDAGGQQSDNASMLLVQWGEGVHGIYPKGSQAGLVHDDYGEETVEVTAGVAGSRMRAFRERWQWKAGLVVADWRSVVRIANIDASDLAGATPPDLISFMEAADEIMPNTGGRRVFYANRRVTRYLRKFVRSAVSAGGGLTFENFAGKRVLTFDGIPIRRVDAMLSTEARVV